MEMRYVHVHMCIFLRLPILTKATNPTGKGWRRTRPSCTPSRRRTRPAPPARWSRRRRRVARRWGRGCRMPTRCSSTPPGARRCSAQVRKLQGRHPAVRPQPWHSTASKHQSHSFETSMATPDRKLAALLHTGRREVERRLAEDGAAAVRASARALLHPAVRCAVASSALPRACCAPSTAPLSPPPEIPPARARRAGPQPDEH